MLEYQRDNTDYQFDLGTYSRPVTTTSKMAQRWFDRGLNWIFAYNHEEADGCFKKALEYDPDCPMAYWGIAYCIGPNYNKPWELFDEKDVLNTLKIAREATEAAIARSGPASTVEKELIGALRLRYQAEKPVPDLYVWSKQYSDEMRQIYKRHSTDPDVATLFAEALMNRFPWKMWDPRTGEMTEGADTAECQRILESGIEAYRAKGLQHPGLWHLYLHLMEMSPVPEKALRVGDELRRMVPDSGHLAHMPTHIDVLCGNYQDVVDWNHIGIEKDVKFWKHAGAMNFYSMYRVHNYHFKQYGAMFLGQYAPALEAVQTMHDTIPHELVCVESPPMADWLEAYMSIGTHTYIRFGRWQEAIDDPLPEDQKLYCTVTAMNWYGKAVAYANLKQIDKALDAQAAFDRAYAAVPDTRHLHVVPARLILAVAEQMLAGELEYHRGNHEAAFRHLREAVELEDNLPYDEPWGWMMPSRHALGALLLDQGQVKEAAEAYEADLGLNNSVLRSNRHPNNVWALLGLHKCYERLGESAKAAIIKPQLDVALARADKEIYASCFCASKKSCCCGGH